MPSMDSGGARVGPVQRLLAVAGLVVTAPVVALASILIRVASPGPVLYRAARAGRDAQPFTMLKLRTMHLDAGQHGAITGGDDPRIFGAGRWLRRLKLDEVPQLVNVARGEMAFVGPRPEAPDIVRDHYLPWMRETLTVPPGIVGPGSLGYFLEEAQLPSDPAEAERLYVEELLPRKLARDLVLVRRYTLGYQLQLVLRTLLGIVGLDRLGERWRAEEDARAAELLAELSGERGGRS